MATPPTLNVTWLARRSDAVQWLLLLLLSLVLAAALELARLPAALLVGPMLAGIVAGTSGATIRVPAVAFSSAQGVVGCLIAAAIEPAFVTEFLHQWPLLIAVVLVTVAASSVLGYLISRWKILPGTTAVWGSAPGAASAMVMMADLFGADARLVAFMQYLRVMMVSVAAALIAGLWVDTSGVERPATEWFPAIDPPAFATTIAVVIAGGLLARMLRMPMLLFLAPMLLGIALHLGAGLPLQLPEWLLAASYALIGWKIGLSFNRSILVHTARALPKVTVSILLLMAFCGGLAWLLNHVLGVDPLTAYLATSPGGMDSVAIIAAASQDVDISFIMALQMLRFLVVLALGPPVARRVARMVKT